MTKYNICKLRDGVTEVLKTVGNHEEAFTEVVKLRETIKKNEWYFAEVEVGK